jgi:hypothetical protein
MYQLTSRDCGAMEVEELCVVHRVEVIWRVRLSFSFYLLGLRQASHIHLLNEDQSIR